MRFPAVQALDDVSLDFNNGEVHGVIGENGAGKSTLMRILAGLQVPTSGEVLLDDAPIRPGSVREALAHGIAMIHQELNLVDELDVADNVFLGRERVRGGLLDRVAMIAETRALLEEVKAPFGPTTRVGSLSIAGKQLVEIAKALSVDASVLIMDEPTAVLSAPEAEALFGLIRRLREKGVAVLYISHRLPEVLDLCDRISVLRDGRLVAAYDPRSEPVDPQTLASSMVGRPMSDMFPPKPAPPSGDPILVVEGATVEGFVEGVSFVLRPGEVLGFAGLVGAGRTELAEALFGARPLRSGMISILGRPVVIRSPGQAMRHRLAYVSEDRKGIGLILSLSSVRNVTLANLRAYARPFLSAAAERGAAERWKQELDIRAGDLDAPILYLSGGNQQKVSLAKWLDTGPRILILDEPTRGVDVGAKRELYALIRDLTAQGLACIVISSELPEIIGLCDRALVLREGRPMGEVAGESLTEEAIMRLAAGVEAAA